MNKIYILLGFCFILISILFVYGNKSLPYLLNKISLLKINILFIKNLNEEKNVNIKEMCTTKWYKNSNLEFSAFSTNNLSKVMFMMDPAYSNVIKHQFYNCIFFKFGTNDKLNPQPLKRIGGKSTYDPHYHTLCLECSIPIEAIDSDTIKIDFILIADNDYINIINISVCRSYDSSFNFLNSQIYLENQSDLKLINKTKRSYRIGGCTQTSDHDLNFPLWLNYHYKMGIDHFYIYDHAPSNKTQLHKNLKSYIDLNLITIIPWYVDQWNGFKLRSSSSDWIAHQIWSQNDCIHRYGYLYSWLLISDVDEFILPMNKFNNFQSILDIVPSNYCALQVFAYNFKGLEKSNISVAEQDRPSMCNSKKKNIHRDFLPKSRDVQSKNFVRPQLIHYFSVHQVTQPVNGAPVFYANAITHARLQHYKSDLIPPERVSQYMIDTRILSFLIQINNSVSSIIFK